MARLDRHGVWPPSRTIAKRLGTIHFLTDRPCSRGHVALRITSSGNCLICKREAQREIDLARLAAWKVDKETPELRRQIEAKHRAIHRHQRNAKKREAREFDRFLRQIGEEETT